MRKATAVAADDVERNARREESSFRFAMLRGAGVASPSTEVIPRTKRHVVRRRLLLKLRANGMAFRWIETEERSWQSSTVKVKRLVLMLMPC